MVTNFLLSLGLTVRVLSVFLLVYVLIQQVLQFRTHSFVQYLKGMLLLIGITGLLSNIVPIIAYIDFLQHKHFAHWLQLWGQALNSLEAMVLSVVLYFVYKTAKNKIG